LLLAVAFECGYAFVDKRWSTPFDKDQWGLIYWLAVGIIVATNQLIPQTLQMPRVLVPFGFVVIVHLLICVSGGSFERYGTHHKASGNTHSSTNRSPSDKELFSKRQAGQNNNNCRPEGDEE
jgi:hypothetical protein